MEHPPIAHDALLKHSDFLRALSRGLFRDAHASEDLVQETWVRALERPPSRVSSLRGWLGTVARNLSIQSRRELARREAREQAAARPEAIEAGMGDRERVLRAVTDAVLELEDPYRATVLLRYFDGLDPARIAERQGVPVATVRSRLQRAHARLRERLDREFPNDRRAWGLALLSWTGDRASSAFPPTLVGAAVMSTGTKIAIGASILVVAGSLLWVLDVNEAPPPGAVSSPGIAEVTPPSTAEPERVAVPVEEPQSPLEQPLRRVAATASGTGSILVRVRRKETGEPIPEARLALRRSTSDGGDPYLERMEGRTDSQGEFRFESVLPGSVRVSSHHGFETGVDVRAGGEAQVEIAVGTGLTVHGSVVDPAGSPVSGARISVASSPDEPGQVIVHSASDGRFVLAPLARGSVVSARHAEKGPSGIVRLSGNPGDVVEVRLECLGKAGRIEGRVAGPDGAPIVGALVRVDDAEGRGMYANGRLQGTSLHDLRTDAEGRFVQEGIAPPQCRVHVRARGLAVWGEYVRVEEDRTARLDVSLQAGVRVRGKIHGVDGSPASGVTVGAGPPERSADFSIFGHRTTTRPDGTYEMEGVGPGPIEVWAEDRTRPREERPGRVGEILRASAGEELVWNGAFVATASLRGRVVDERGSPLAALIVGVRNTRLIGATSASGRATTDAEGRFRIDRLQADEIAVEVWEGRRTAIHNQVLVTTTPWPGPAEIVLAIPDSARPTATITGRLVGEHGRPARARLIVELPSRGTWNPFDVDDRDGGFRLGPLRPETYRLRAESEPGVMHALGVHRVSARETLELGDIAIARTGTVRIEVLHPERVDTTDLSFWVVSVDPEDERCGFSLLADRMSGPRQLAPGSYVLRVRGRFVRHQDLPFRIESDVETRLVIDPTATSARLFRLVPPSGRPQADRARIEVLDEQGRLVEARDEDSSGAAWLYAQFSLAPGRYTVRTTTASGLRGEVSISVREDEPQVGEPIEILLR